MIHIGAKGKSADELSSLLGSDYSIILRNLSESLERENIIANISNVYKICCESCEIHNKIFFDCQLNQNYIDLLQRFFGIELEKISFQNPEISCDLINSWISKNTHGRITEGLAKIHMAELLNIDENTIFMLINTIYFKSDWKVKFDTALTSNDKFFVNPQKTVIVPMMHKTERHLFYLNKQKFLKHFTNKQLKECIKLAQEVEVDVILPKFKLQQRFSVKDILLKMGVIEIFDRNCDLSNISDMQVYISDVIHSAK
ncbi:hypothetical protein MXB_2383, partial [Myxobolus squamalis]